MRVWLLPILLIALLGAGCEREPAPLRLAVSLWPGYEYLYLAEQEGLFAEAGVAVDLVSFGSLGDLRRAFERGQVDGMTSTLVELLQACDHVRRCGRAVLVTDWSHGADRIIARRDIGDVADLAGRPVGVEPATLGAYLLERALAEAGAPGTARPVPIPSGEMAGALAEGRVDAVVIWPPTATRLAADPDLHTLFTSADLPGEIVDVVALDPAVIAARPDAVAGLIRAWQMALDFDRRHPERARALMARREGLTVAEFNAALADLKIVPLADQPALLAADGPVARTLIRIRDHLARAGRLAADTPVDLVDGGPAQAAIGSMDRP